MKSTLLAKSFRILDRIASSPAPVTLKELASDLELNASTVSRIASDLAAHNLIRKGVNKVVFTARKGASAGQDKVILTGDKIDKVVNVSNIRRFIDSQTAGEEKVVQVI